MKIRISTNEKLSMISTLATLLNAGIPILEAMDSLLEDAKGGQRKILVMLKADLNQGHTIAQSLAKVPDAFDPVTVNLIKASEEAGTLDVTLKDITEGIRKDMEFNDKVKAAMTYPALVCVAFLGVMLLMLTFVIPRIGSVFSKLKVNLPLPTVILIALSNFVLKYGIYLAIVSVILIFGIVYLYKTNKRQLLNVLMSLPLLNRLGRQIDLAHFTRSMALLLSSGIPIIDALELSKNVVYKKEVYQVVAHAVHSVSAGKHLSESFKLKKNVIPSIMRRITEAGEKSGTLEKSMEELAQYFDIQVTNNLKTATTMIEPIMLVLIGVLVGGMMMSVIAPIYGLIGQINGQQ